jgi:hypothetical protein
MLTHSLTHSPTHLFSSTVYPFYLLYYISCLTALCLTALQLMQYDMSMVERKQRVEEAYISGSSPDE